MNVIFIPFVSLVLFVAKNFFAYAIAHDKNVRGL